MFIVKKILGHLLMPLPFALGLVGLGLFCFLIRRKARGWLFLLSGCAVLALAGNRAVAFRLTSGLENTYAPVPPSTVAAPNLPDGLADTGLVAVLGGGHGDAARLAAGQRLSTSARARLVEGMRIALLLPDSWLVVSGPRNGDSPDASPSHARVLADSAVELGFPRDRIVEIDTARDTAEETLALRQLAGDERVALVTSAWHLPRAMKLATSAGLDAFPCPCDFLAGRDERIDPLAYGTWDAESLVNSTRAWREYLGQGWAWLVARWQN
jgi:uncharacterized SAM-binding protein YcdF (DUF218 family)